MSRPHIKLHLENFDSAGALYWIEDCDNSVVVPYKIGAVLIDPDFVDARIDICVDGGEVKTYHFSEMRTNMHEKSSADFYPLNKRMIVNLIAAIGRILADRTICQER